MPNLTDPQFLYLSSGKEERLYLAVAPTGLRRGPCAQEAVCDFARVTLTTGHVPSFLPFIQSQMENCIALVCSLQQVLILFDLRGLGLIQLSFRT